MKIHVVLLILFLLTMTGCVEKEILDDIALEIGRAYDEAEGNKIVGTTLVYNFMPDKSIQNTTHTTTATTSRELMNKLQQQAPEPLSEGSIEVFLFGKELAKKGLQHYLDAPQRNPSIGARLFLVVVDGNAQELITGNYGSRGNAIFISNLLKHNSKHENLPKTNLQLFFHDYWQEGKTGYLPQIKKMAQDKLELNGISLFKGDDLRVVDTIGKSKMFYFKLLVDRFSEGSHKIKIKEGESVLRSITSRHKMKLTKRNPEEITIYLKIKGVTREFTGMNKLTPQVVKKFEKEMEKEISQECEKLIKRFQEKGVDPVGFGFFVKTQTRGFDYKKWNEEDYKNLKVKVKSDVTIMESGVLE